MWVFVTLCGCEGRAKFTANAMAGGGAWVQKSRSHAKKAEKADDESVPPLPLPAAAAAAATAAAAAAACLLLAAAAARNDSWKTTTCALRDH